MAKARFDAELIEGHKSVTVVLVPFNPEELWKQKPVRLDPRRDGWLVEGTVNRVPFTSYVGDRWGRFFIILEPAVREAARVAVGDTISVVVEPSLEVAVLVKARELSKVTTAPPKGRADAIELSEAGAASGKTGKRAVKNAPAKNRVAKKAATKRATK